MLDTINRRPFSVDNQRLLADGKIWLDGFLADNLTAEEEAEIVEATNNRFESFLDLASSIGQVNHSRYPILIDTFIERIVKSCCAQT